jgi:DNA-binding NarL/FixJ family response regulator
METQPASRKTGDGIQIVENEIVLAEDLLLTLQELGYTVCGSVGSREAVVALAEKTKTDRVLMDIKLDGAKTIRRMRFAWWPEI